MVFNISSYNGYCVADSVGGVTKQEQAESEAKSEGEREEEGERGEPVKDSLDNRRMSYPGDHVMEEDPLQYRVQGSFSQHRYDTFGAVTLSHV